MPPTRHAFETLLVAFEVSESTHHRMMSRVTSFLLDIAPSVIKFPSDLQKLATDFEQLSGFPDTIGCVDGSYVSSWESALCLCKQAPLLIIGTARYM
ncbi:hypothetical protein HPB48_018718 [Haemaphysalis longicornis]|uniref:Uncharacterized protein n=1 Tax=Haemaphysalis longicornis TaxID=44386 RepID=A0A9J6GN13_HAELO|nr:hypothetical protein HPB48_018718 [Haemaphysalis longicornis]